MDLQSFIQSGILEAYVAGQCDATERQQVEQMAAQHPEIRAELAKIEQVLEQFAVANAVAPPAGLKERILDQLDKIPDVSMPDASKTDMPKPGTASLRLYQALTLLGILAAAFFFWQRSSLAAEHEELKRKADALQVQIDDCSRRSQQTAPMAALLRDTDTKPVALTDGKAYHITIFNNNLRKECALDISGLPVPAAGKYFQCWAIVGGKPVSLGMVQMDAVAGWQPLPFIENAEAYAISEETNPQGNPTPTFVIAIGKLDIG